MISRRLLRIKALQIIYSYFQSDERSIAGAEKELFHSIDKSYELYHYLLLLLIEIVDYAESRIDLARNKRIPTHEDLNPNTKFIDNKIIAQLKENKDLEKFLNEKKVSWVNYPEIIKNLYIEIAKTDLYQNYMGEDSRSYSMDKKFVTTLLSEIIIHYEPIYQNFEEQSIYWNDDADFIISMIIRTLKAFKEENGENNRLMPLFKSDEDKDFVKRLFRKSILNFTDNEQLVSGYVKNWDIERVAFLDTLIMTIAIAEVIEFSSIPIKVTLDEFIEISKFYSTQKSSVFINGILDKVINDLKNTGKIKKSGRGLIGEL